MSDRGLRTPWDSHYMLPAFLGCVHWALADSEVLAAFRAATGNQWKPGKTRTDQMVDSACGADLQFLQQFSDWVAENMFGKPEDLFGER